MRYVALLVAFLTACGGRAGPPSLTPVPSALPVVELKYRVFDQVGRPWYCDPDFYPISRADEKELARQRLPEMQKDAADTYAAILGHNALGAGANLTDDQLLAVYHDWKDLQRLPLDPTGPPGIYGSTFVVRPQTATKSGERVELRIDTGGRITVLSRTQAGPPNCPICLADTTRIDTPAGPRPVTDLRPGNLVWTIGASGERLAAPILEVGSVQAPLGHEVLRVGLADSRSVTASPGHPTADGSRIGSLEVGEMLDGTVIVAIERLPYRGRTYDLLPAGATGAYWADGILLGTTLR